MNQLTFADVRPSDPDTSHEAAASQTPERRSRGQWLVLRALAEHGPLTDFQHQAINGLQQTSAGKRRRELQRAGLVEAVPGVSPSGSRMKVWRLTAEGRQAYLDLDPDG